MDEAYLTHLFYMHKDALFQHFEQYDELLKIPAAFKILYPFILSALHLKKPKQTVEAALRSWIPKGSVLGMSITVITFILMCTAFSPDDVDVSWPLRIEGKITRVWKAWIWTAKAIDCEIQLPEIYLPKKQRFNWMSMYLPDHVWQVRINWRV